mmetsp:Transcript_31045/g.92364  ORF Transcript_31045/g.92364 Transcript_31045/m.92364 type:complete len:296 (+) Transcript_31045:1059-1946(+)
MGRSPQSPRRREHLPPRPGPAPGGALPRRPPCLAGGPQAPHHRQPPWRSAGSLRAPRRPAACNPAASPQPRTPQQGGVRRARRLHHAPAAPPRRSRAPPARRRSRPRQRAVRRGSGPPQGCRLQNCPRQTPPDVRLLLPAAARRAALPRCGLERARLRGSPPLRACRQPSGPLRAGPPCTPPAHCQLPRAGRQEEAARSPPRRPARQRRPRLHQNHSRAKLLRRRGSVAPQGPQAGARRCRERPPRGSCSRRRRLRRRSQIRARERRPGRPAERVPPRRPATDRRSWRPAVSGPR